MSRPSKKPRKHSGRVTLGPCSVLGDDRLCEPLNQILIRRTSGKSAYGSCSCGRRFPPDSAAVIALDAKLQVPSVLPEGAIGDADASDILATELWPIDKVTPWSKIGVAPLGTPSLHRPTRYLTEIAEAARSLSVHMLRVMSAAEGIGLASNQVAVPLRVLVHNLPRVAPALLVNAEIVAGDGVWRYAEGCLSVNIDDTRAFLERPKRVLVRASLLDGGDIALFADEVFGRVLQHEIDHLDGIEYVQRLTGDTQRKIYERLAEAGVNLDWIPLRPYA